MINNNFTQNSSIFNSFPDYSLQQSGFDAVSVKNPVKKQNEQDKKAENQSSEQSSVQTPSQDKVDLTNKKQPMSSKKKKILFGSTIASSILTAGVVSLFILKGQRGGFLKNKLSNWSTQLGRDIHDASQNGINGILAKIDYNLKKGTKKVLDFLQSSSNFNTFKDHGANTLLHTNKVTGAFADKSTSAFKRVVDKTLGKKYSRVEMNVRNISTMLKECDIKTLRALSPEQQAQKITIKNKTQTLAQWIDDLERQVSRLEVFYDGGFSAGARKSRDIKRTGLLADLPDKINKRFFSSKKALFDVNNYTTYATEDLAKPAQEELRRQIINSRKHVSNSIPYISEEIKSSISNVSGIIKPDDVKTREALQTLRKHLQTFRACSGKMEDAHRTEISKKMISLIDDVVKGVSDNGVYSENEKKLIKSLLEEAQASIGATSNGSSKGALQEIMTILKGLNSSSVKVNGQKIVSNSDYKAFSKISDKIASGLKDATDLEAGEYFLKQAELKVGSAPNDVLSVLLPIGVGAYSIGKADDKDERISATLTTCIPLVGTFATFVYGTVKMLSGAKNLAFSTISGLALSALGNYADKLYKEYKSSGSISNVVKTEADKLWTGLEPQLKQFEEISGSTDLKVQEKVEEQKVEEQKK